MSKRPCKSANSKMIEGRIGARILINRRRVGITLEQLSKRCGVHRNTIQRIESGAGCSASVLACIAAGLRVEVSALIPKVQHVVQEQKNTLFEREKPARVVCGTENAKFSEPGDSKRDRRYDTAQS